MAYVGKDVVSTVSSPQTGQRRNRG